MKLKDIFVFSLNRVGEHQGDRQIENIIISGINAGYKIIAIKNKMTKNITISTEINVPVTLPNDYIGTVLLLKDGLGGGRLNEYDYFSNNDTLLITNPDVAGDLTLYYNFIPLDLVKGKDDNVEPSIQAAYHIALASYAAYYYYLFKGNFDAATMCLNEFNSITGLAEEVSVTNQQDIQKQESLNK